MQLKGIDISDLIKGPRLYRAIGIFSRAFWLKYHKGDITGSVLIDGDIYFSRSNVNIRYSYNNGGDKFRAWVAKGRPIESLQQKDSITDTLSPPGSNG